MERKSELYTIMGELFAPSKPQQLDTTEPVDTWHCTECGCLCAGVSTPQLCNTCEQIRNIRDAKAESISEFLREDHEQYVTRDFEIRNENRF